MTSSLEVRGKKENRSYAIADDRTGKTVASFKPAELPCESEEDRMNFMLGMAAGMNLASTL